MIIRPILTAYTAEAIPAGPNWKYPHPKRSAVSMASNITTNRFGSFIMTTPNPVFIFLNYVEKIINDADLLSIEINKATKTISFNGDLIIHRVLSDKLLYEYFEKASIIPILLCTSLEAFVNQNIPENFIYKKDNKESIERNLSFNVKFLKVMKNIFKLDIYNEIYWSDFLKTKNLRDDLIHLKTAGKHYAKAYDKIFLDLIDLDLKKQLENTINIMKFYKPTFFDK